MDTHKQTLLKMARLSDDAYEIGPKNTSNYKIIYSSDKKTKLGIWKKTKDQIYIGFKGTDSFKDVLVDVNAKQGKFSFLPNKYSYNVHKGFKNTYKSANLSKIKNILNDEKISSIWITGHSLGGALATLCAMDLSINYKLISNKILLYTFASPMIGDKIFHRHCNTIVKNNLRCFIDKDLIPNLPPSIIDKYFSVGSPKKLKNPYSSSSPSELAYNIASVLPSFMVFSNLIKIPAVYNHHKLDTYKKAIRKLKT